ncbi:hypothetical protein Golomagni_04207, partial [Golovinomyces magnicellulatus]
MQQVKLLHSQNTSLAYFQTFLACFEGIEGWSNDNFDEKEQLLKEMCIDDEADGIFFSESGEVDGAQTVAIPRDQS